MSNSYRIFVYFAGFIIGAVLVSVILKRRASDEERQPDPWVAHKQDMMAAGAKPLPDGVPDSIRAGLLIDYGELPDLENPLEAVWLLTFEESYPYVRVVQNLSNSELSYMAADQITIRLADGVDATAVKPMLDELGLRLRMFNRKEQLVIIGVLSNQVDAIPATIRAVQPWKHLFSSAEPDFIRFQPKKLGK